MAQIRLPLLSYLVTSVCLIYPFLSSTALSKSFQVNCVILLIVVTEPIFQLPHNSF